MQRETLEVIYGSTPLEDQYVGVHPRLHFNQADLDALRSKLKREPWKSWLSDVRECASSSTLHQAFVFAVTREPEALSRTERMVKEVFKQKRHKFCTGYMLACVYDWLYHDLKPAMRKRLQTYLDETFRPQYEAFAKHEVYAAGTIGWNISSEELGNIAAAGFALYGDIPKMAPWVRFVTEKARVVTQALGSDGVSSEGICYGGFFNETYVKTLDLVDRLMGVDLFENNTYLQNVPWIYLFSALPRRRMKSNNSVLCLGDGARWHWYGPSSYLHKIAARYGDPLAQSIAARHQTTEANAKTAPLFSLLWYDASVSMRQPSGLPLSRHFVDKDIVAMRSDWKGDESIVLFKCGPHGGHKALRQYPQCIAGGHMAADAGSFLFYGHGERLISDGGYARKYTEYRNTVLVNGVGQTGACEGPESSDWFECLDLRREKRGPSLLKVDSGKIVDYMIGNVAPAYKPEAGLKRYLRHLIYIRPDTVVVVDELVAAKASMFELWFHADSQPHGTPDCPFEPIGENVWESCGQSGRCRIASMATFAVVADAGLQRIEGVGAHGDHDTNVLCIRNSRPRAAAVFITVLDAFGVRQHRPVPTLNAKNGVYQLTLTTPNRAWHLTLKPGRKNPADSILSRMESNS